MKKKKVLLVNDRYFTPEFMRARLKWLSKYNLEFSTFTDHPGENQESFHRRMLDMEVNGPSEKLAPAELKKVIKDINILVVHFTIVPASVIKFAENLEFIGILRGGWENVDLKEASANHIFVSNSPGRSADAVADFTIGLMICESKNIVRGSIALRNGAWGRQYINSEYQYNLKGQTIGLIGFGQVGSRVAKKLSGFEVNILVYDPFIEREAIIRAGCQPVSLDELLTHSDFVSVHYRYTKETKNLIDSREISLMKSTAYLINTAREGIVNSKALIKALKERTIGGAALDVFEEEPLSNNSPFLELDNVTLTPHLAGISLNSIYAPFEILGEEIERFLKNESLKYNKSTF